MEATGGLSGDFLDLSAQGRMICVEIGDASLQNGRDLKTQNDMAQLVLEPRQQLDPTQEKFTAQLGADARIQGNLFG